MVQQVVVPQLWDDLVMAACGRQVYFSVMHGGKPEASLQESDEEMFTLERSSEMMARPPWPRQWETWTISTASTTPRFAKPFAP